MDRDFNPADGGYIQVMNEFMDHLAQGGLTKNEYRIMCLMMRWIWGVKGRAWAALSWRFMLEKTGLSEAALSISLRQLVAQNILLTKCEKEKKYYKINSKPSTWQPLSKPKVKKYLSKPKGSLIETESPHLAKPKVAPSETESPPIKNNIKTELKTELKTPLYTPWQSGTDIDAKNIVDFINHLSGKKFKYSKTSLTPINARLKEGYSVEQCMAVCQNKWLDPDLKEKYFRPVTLFRESLFESYVNEIGSHRKPTKQQTKSHDRMGKWQERYEKRRTQD